MDVAEQLKDDLREGRLDPYRLVDLIVALQRDLQAANQRIADLEKQLANSTTRVDEPFSLRAEEKRQEARGKKKRKAKRQGRRGRFTTAEKVAQAERSEDVVPDVAVLSVRSVKQPEVTSVWLTVERSVLANGRPRALNRLVGEELDQEPSARPFEA